ncbi:hypothetical protein GCM10027451_38210 [Geodermatophilus aquaeductus]
MPREVGTPTGSPLSTEASASDSDRGTGGSGAVRPLAEPVSCGAGLVVVTAASSVT